MSAWGDLPIAPVVGMWAEACFPVESKTTEAEVNNLLEEAAEKLLGKTTTLHQQWRGRMGTSSRLNTWRAMSVASGLPNWIFRKWYGEDCRYCPPTV